MTRLTLFAILFAIANSSYAQQNKGKSKGFFSAGINPLYPFFRGYGVKAFYNFPSKWSVGILGEGNFKLPNLAAKQFFKSGEHINVDWDYSFGMEARYRFRKKDNNIKGFYTLGTLGYEGWSITKQKDQTVVTNTLQEEKFSNWFSSLGFGFNTFPFKKSGFWIGAQYNIIFILNNTKQRNVNGINYNIRSIVPPSFMPNLYIGWQF